MILGHLTSTYVLSDLLKKKGFRVCLPALLPGALLPDLIDKPVSFFFSYPGRGGAHSAVVLTVLFFLILMFTGRKETRSVILTVYAGSLLHLLQDFASPDVVLWPFLESWDAGSSLSFIEKLDLFYLERSVPAQWWIEVLSILYILGAFFRRVLPSRKNSPLTAET